MGLELGVQIADETGSGNDYLLALDTPVAPGDMALVLVCHEPLYLAATYTIAVPASTLHKHVVARVRMPDSSDPYESRAMLALGFGEYEPMNQARHHALSTLAPKHDGLPATEEYIRDTPGGFRAEVFRVAPEPGGADIDQLLIHFDRLSPRAAQAVDWFRVKVWHLTGYNPDAPTLLGTTGTNSTEPDVFKAYPSHPTFPGNLQHYSPGAGETALDIAIPTSSYVSDGGETALDGPIAIPPHILDVALAGRWGFGDGTWTWEDGYPWTLLDTTERDQGGGIEAHVEMSYRILAPPAATDVSARGTFGTQTAGGVGVDSYYRWTGGLLRAAAIRCAIKPSGGWLPQIYRRMIEVEVG